MADVVKLLVSAFVLGFVIYIIRRIELVILGSVQGMPEVVQKYKLLEIVFALVLIMFGGKIHKLVPEAGMIILAVTFADLIQENLKF